MLLYRLARIRTRWISSRVERKRKVARYLYPECNADEALMRMQYRCDTGRELDLQNPRDISEKLHWLKINDRRISYGRLVDKYAVREFVAEKVGEYILNECLGVYGDPDEIDFAALPQKFAIKATHGSDVNLLCREKSELNWEAAKIRMREWLSLRHELRHGEWPYSLVTPRLMAEAWMEESSGDLSDYKFHCFTGEPKFFQIDRGRATVRSQGYFDLNWRPLPFRHPRYAPLSGDVKAPPRFDRMIDIARRLSGDIPFVRVDLYNLGGDIRFGELTLYPRGGKLTFEPREWNLKVGEMLKLPVPRYEDKELEAYTTLVLLSEKRDKSA